MFELGEYLSISMTGRFIEKISENYIKIQIPHPSGNGEYDSIIVPTVCAETADNADKRVKAAGL